MPGHLTSLADAGVSWHPDVDDLTPLYEDARVFVAPTRYAAGIPLKIVEAAARGVPIVCTPLLADQLGWTAGGELLTAETPADFARTMTALYSDPDLWRRLREAALQRVARDYSASVFRATLKNALGVAIS
jgi:glycosyltransferase involved in cell wall biosynthesis